MTGERQGDPRERKSKLHKAALLSAGLALAIVVDGPAAFGANNNKNNPTNHELYVEEVSVTFSTEDTSTAELGDCAAGSDRLTIHGVNFDNGAPPVVTFGKVESLTICSADDTTIVAELLNSVKDGDYRLSVSTGPSVKDFSEYDLTVGAVGPQGIQGDRGNTGDTGDTGDRGDKGDKGESGADVRIASFLQDGSTTCSYTAVADQTFSGSCSCHCSTPVPSFCSCTCERVSELTSDTIDSCSAAGLTVNCPDVGGIQGESAVASCRGDGVVTDNACAFNSPRTITGPPSSCMSSTKRDCSCTCFSGLGSDCSCSCSPESVTLICKGETQNVTRTEQAVCLKVEPVTQVP